ncbi:MAG: hypothetical protein WBC90_03185 [Albidovulum sp.]
MGKSMKFKAGKVSFCAALSVFLPAPASAYEVDCAILLCLSGGWPASAECSYARGVFIQRITPWPIEPPLQIWRCPMGSAMNSESGATPGERLHNLAFADSPVQSVAVSQEGAIQSVFTRNDSDPATSELFRYLAREISEENGAADIDVSGSEFDFVRSIKVWNVMHYSHAKRGRNDECREHSNIQLGTYGTLGEFQWDPSEPGQVPNWVIPSRSCEPGSYARAVGVEWTDVEGNHGYEVVIY